MDQLLCPFCSRDIFSRLFLCSKYSFAILARHGVEPGQSLVIPKRHVATLEDLSAHEAADLMNLIAKSVSTLREHGAVRDVNIAINLGQMAGQSVDHLHVHIIPRVVHDTVEPKRWLADDLFAKLREKSDYELSDLCKRLRNVENVQNRLNEENCDKSFTKNECNEDEYIKYNIDSKYSQKFTDSELKISIGARALIRSGTVIYRDVIIGDGFECGHNILIRTGARIGAGSCVYTGAQIHKDVSIGSGCIIGGWIGNGAVIGNNVRMFGELIHKYKASNRGATELAPIIMDDAFVGWNAIVVGGVRIGKRSIVGAGSVVVSDVQDDWVVAGNPARQINS